MSWHKDATYFGLEPHEQVTAWVALTDASEEAGCMEVLSAHGKPRQMHHAALRLKDSGHASLFYWYVAVMMVVTFLVSLRLPRRASYLTEDP